ncbi:hypothetical protein, partial [Ralstonia pseudosolanacearum]|uniref:hypothetical protein n=1 Tax=Ralstonia pseudosolanacearum TaxID=1310165 RepID=UPI003AAC154E
IATFFGSWRCPKAAPGPSTAPKRRTHWLQKLRQTVGGAILGHEKSANFDFCATHKNSLTPRYRSTTMSLLRCTIPSIAMSPGRLDADRHALYIRANYF